MTSVARIMSIPVGEEVSLAAEGFGDRGNPTVLLGHGGGQCRHVWADTAERLAAAGYHAVTIDSRGHGDSDWADPPRYEPEDFARDFLAVARWRQEEDGRPPHYVGSSQSGIAGLLAAGETIPAPFASLTLVDVTPTYDEGALTRARSLFEHTADKGFATEAEAARMAGVVPGSRHVEKVLRRDDDGRWYWKWDPAFARFIHHNTSTQRRCLDAAGNLRLPVHLLRAGHSEFVTDKSVAAFEAVTPHLVVTMLPDSRHIVTGDPRGIYATAIRGFLRSLPGGIDCR